MPTKPSIPRTCQTCGKDFLAHRHQVKAGYGKFCGHKCYRSPNRPLLLQRTCLTCGSGFSVQQKQRSRNYCSVNCASKARSIPLNVRFWANVDKTEGCWIWTGGKTVFGYGSISERTDGSKRAYNTHRVSYELHYGSIPEGLCVLHRCDNPPCVRPDHLFLGTRKDNIADMDNKGRRVNGQKGNHHKLSESQVRQIRSLYQEGATNQDGLAGMFGVHPSTIHYIVTQKRWKHVV